MKPKLFSKIVQLVTTLSIAASILPVGMMTASAADIVIEHDWCLDESGNIRDGVDIIGHFVDKDGKEYTIQKNQTPKDVGSFDNGGGTPSYILDGKSPKGLFYSGFGFGWGSAAKSPKTYVQVDLGAVRNIDKIGITPIDHGDEYWRRLTVRLSNDPEFSTYDNVIGPEVIEQKTLKEFEFTSPKNYRYIRILTSDGYKADGDCIAGLARLEVKGNETISETDLLHDSDGKLSATLTASHSGGTGTLENMVDGKYTVSRYGTDNLLDQAKATSYISTFGYPKEDKWIQADLGSKKKISSIKALIFPGTRTTDTYFRRDVEIRVSNDPTFASYKILAKTNDNLDAYMSMAEPWLEYSDETASGEYRYIRVIQVHNQQDTALGVTELQVNGYNISYNPLLYTNIDQALMDSETDTSKIRVSNFANAADCFLPWNEARYSYAMAVNNRLQFVFDGRVDPASVTAGTVSITTKYQTGSSQTTATISTVASVDNDKIYIDMNKFDSNAVVTLKFDGIKVNGKKTDPITLMFRTGAVAPLPYKAGRVIKNVAAGKNVWDTTTNAIHDGNYNGVNTIVDNHLVPNEDHSHHDLIIDLGAEYDISAYGISTNQGTAWWHIEAFDIYMSQDKDTVSNESNMVIAKADKRGTYGTRNHANCKFDKAKRARYIYLDRDGDGNTCSEFLAYAYAPATSETGIADSYFKFDGTNYTFKVEKDGEADSTILVARYDNKDNIVDVVMSKENSVIYDNTGTNEDGTPYTVKGLVWDMNNLKPLNVKSDYTTEVQKTITCWGDSLTMGNSWKNEGSWPRTLAELSDCKVNNYGVGGEDVSTIAARQGGLTMQIQSEVTIPSDTTAVEVSLLGSNGRSVKPLLQDSTGARGINPCYLGGVKGNLSQSGGQYYFTREEEGEETTVSKNSDIVTNGMLNCRDDIIVCWLGQNGGTDTTQELADIISGMVNYLDYSDKQFVVIGLAHTTAADSTLKATFGDNFLPLHDYLVNNALSDMGITPTEADKARIAADKVPTSLMANANEGEVHFNDTGYAAIGRLVYNKLVTLGYIPSK